MHYGGSRLCVRGGARTQTRHKIWTVIDVIRRSRTIVRYVSNATESQFGVLTELMKIDIGEHVTIRVVKGNKKYASIACTIVPLDDRLRDNVSHRCRRVSIRGESDDRKSHPPQKPGDAEKCVATQ
jgi:hypothetical protein